MSLVVGELITGETVAKLALERDPRFGHQLERAIDRRITHLRVFGSHLR